MRLCLSLDYIVSMFSSMGLIGPCVAYTVCDMLFIIIILCLSLDKCGSGSDMGQAVI